MNTPTPITGHLLEAGRITTLDMGGEHATYPIALLITCRTPDDLRAAIKAGSVAFTFCEIPTETPNARN